MSDRLNLKIGKPEAGTNENVATFSRFVLPFAFQLQRIDETVQSSPLFYVSNAKSDINFIKRRKYFTRETADTLYERAQWLNLCDAWQQTPWGKAEVEVVLRGNKFKIGMLPPQIILFETPEIEEESSANNMHTGLLFVDLYFAETQNQPPQLDDLLVLNEFFRYFGIPYDDHANTFKKIFADVPVKANAVETIASLGHLECYFERWATLLEIPLRHNEQLYRLFPAQWGQDARAWMYNRPGSNQSEHWQIYADNRCYLWTAAFLENGGNALKYEFAPRAATLSAKDFGHWIKLLNADNPPFDTTTQRYKTPQDTHADVSEFERGWADLRTYKRWESGGSWYGYCYHASAVLAPPYRNIFSPSATYYFDTIALFLYIRMTLFRISRELSKVMQSMQDHKDNESTRRQLQDLRRQFSSFTVLYRFPLLSNQQQSIEMYEIMRKSLEIDQFFDEVQQEINNTHEFLELIETNRLATAANHLATWGIPLAVGSLIGTLFGMNDFHLWTCIGQQQNCTVSWNLAVQTISAVLAGAAAVFLMQRKNK